MGKHRWYLPNLAGVHPLRKIDVDLQQWLNHPLMQDLGPPTEPVQGFFLK